MRIVITGDGEIARVELGLQVLPFSLSAPKTHYDLSQDYTAGFYYRGRLDPAGKGDSRCDPLDQGRDGLRRFCR